MRDVASVNDERRFVFDTHDVVQRLLERPGDVGIDWLVESQMAVAHLGEGETRFRRLGLADHMGPGNSAGDRPKHCTTGPGHTFQKSAAVRIEKFGGHRHTPSRPGPSALACVHEPFTSVFIPGRYVTIGYKRPAQAGHSVAPRLQSDVIRWSAVP